MQTPILIASLGLLAGLVQCAPGPPKSLSPRQLSAVPIIEAIMPTSTSCAGYSNAAYPDDCRTAAQAAPYLIEAFDKYGIRDAGAMAGLLSVVGYESGDLKYKHNVSPGRPGQGTANMQMSNFNIELAQSLGLTVNASDVAGTLEQVVADAYNFGSAAWFITTQSGCDATVLQGGTDAGFQAYLADCVGVSATSERMAYWDRAKTAFGLSGL